MGTINDFESISMAPEILTAKDNFFVILGRFLPFTPPPPPPPFPINPENQYFEQMKMTPGDIFIPSMTII